MPTDSIPHEAIELDRAAYFDKINAPLVIKYREYAAGKQPKTLTAEQKALLEGVLGNEFCDNVCHQVIAEDSDRLELEWFTVDDAAVQEWLEDWFTTTNLADESGETHYAALRDGNYAVSLSYSEQYGRVCLHREPWWDGNTGVYIGYDAVGEPLYAVKDWYESDNGVPVHRRNVWYEDRVERFQQLGVGTGFEPFTYPGESGPIQAWTKADGSPLHIPIIHFANSGRGPANYGTSEIAGGVLGFQDQLNDLHYDISYAARMTAYQQVWATGVGQAKDTDGNDVPLQVGAGNVLRSALPDAAFGILPAGDMSQLISVYMMKISALSRMTRTPRHAITGGDWPSGKALERAEKPLIEKCGRQVKKFTTAWATVAHRATEIANVFQKATLNEDAIIKPVFADVARPDETTRYEESLAFWKAAFQAAQAGCPLVTFLEDQGWPQDKIDKLVAQQKVEADRDIQTGNSNAANQVPPLQDNGVHGVTA